MDEKLVKNIQSTIEQDSEPCSIVDPEVSLNIIKELSKIYSFSFNDLYWWENVKADVSYKYSDNNEWTTKLSEMIKVYGEEVLLFITDDEYTPWPAFKCNTDRLITLLSGQRFFEYFIVDEKFEYILFDTHHNVLLLVSRHSNGLL